MIFKSLNLHVWRTPSDSILVVATNRPSLPNYSSFEWNLNVFTTHNWLGFLQSILENVHHADIKEIEAASCEKLEESRERKD